MAEKNNTADTATTAADNSAVIEKSDNTKKNDDVSQGSIKFFKNCSSSLKRFSVLLFAINIFFTIIALAVGVALIYIYLGVDLLTLLAVPLISVVIILVILARFMSALVYGFAEIVEKHEDK